MIVATIIVSWLLVAIVTALVWGFVVGRRRDEERWWEELRLRQMPEPDRPFDFERDA